MGAWGIQPFANDGAADWFGDLWERFGVPKRVEETLGLDPEEFHEEIRAAAYLLIQLGDTYRWPVDLIDRHCALAADQLEKMLELDNYEGREFQEAIRGEIQLLRSRVE